MRRKNSFLLFSITEIANAHYFRFLISEIALTRSPTAPSRPGVLSLPAGPCKESYLKNELTE